MIQRYIDIDRTGEGYILTVLHTVNKKQEPIEIIKAVKHLGPVDHWSVVMDYKELDIWSRCIESGDWFRFVNLNYSK